MKASVLSNKSSVYTKIINLANFVFLYTLKNSTTITSILKMIYDILFDETNLRSQKHIF